MVPVATDRRTAGRSVVDVGHVDVAQEALEQQRGRDGSEHGRDEVDPQVAELAADERPSRWSAPG